MARRIAAAVTRRDVVVVGHGIAVGRRVADVALAVAVGIGLAAVGHVRAVIQRVVDAIPVAIAVGRRVAGVAEAVAVGIGLVRVGEAGAVVGHVVDAVRVVIAVGCRVTGIAQAVGVAVDLVGVGDRRAVVLGVADAITILVGRAGVPAAAGRSLGPRADRRPLVAGGAARAGRVAGGVRRRKCPTPSCRQVSPRRCRTCR